MTTAVLFPGQGSQTPGMRDLVARARPDLLEVAVGALGEDPFAHVGEGSRYDQPAILCASLAGFAALGRPAGEALAGHSLGEITALVAAGAIDERDGVALVATRGRLMDEAPAGGMLALLGGDIEAAHALAERHGLVVANDNSPGQVVLAGPVDALEPAAADATSVGARGARRLPVAGAFHSPLMAVAAEPFARALEGIEVRAPSVPVMSCVTAEPFEDVRAGLVAALTGPVRWREVVLALHARGARRFVEVGPGKVLTGLVKRTLDDVELVTADAALAEASHG
jgi:[acyl-carrier-protein] S-malonyltransferase